MKKQKVSIKIDSVLSLSNNCLKNNKIDIKPFKKASNLQNIVL